MTILDEPWVMMIVIIWSVLLISLIPLLILSPIHHRKGKDPKSMWLKYAAWFIMVPAVTLPMLMGIVWMQIMFLFLSLYAFEEFSRAVGLWQNRAHLWLGRVCITLIYVPVFIGWWSSFMCMPAYVILLIFALPITRDTYQGMIQRTCLTILGVLYFGWFLGHLALLLTAPRGRAMVLAFLVIVVMNDASAYLIGSTFGKKRLAPNISPNKTVAGILGSIAVAVFLTFSLRFALGPISVFHTLLLGFTLSVWGTCGDLAISMIKRDIHIKDTGTLIPGHGGLLDRLDSILFTAPVFFHFMKFFYGINSI